MKALVYTGPKSLDYRNAPDPDPGDGEVIVKVEAVGICGSDMHAFLGHDERRPAPLILGHEAAGMVKTGRLAGKRVTVNPLVTCGACEACRKGRNNLCPNRQIISMATRPGAFAEYLAIPETNLVAIPEGVGVEKACLADRLRLACGSGGVAPRSGRLEGRNLSRHRRRRDRPRRGAIPSCGGRHPDRHRRDQSETSWRAEKRRSLRGRRSDV